MPHTCIVLGICMHVCIHVCGCGGGKKVYTKPECCVQQVMMSIICVNSETVHFKSDVFGMPEKSFYSSSVVRDYPVSLGDSVDRLVK